MQNKRMGLHLPRLYVGCCQKEIMIEQAESFGPAECGKDKALGGVVKPNTNMERIPKLGDVVIYNTTKQEQESMGNCPPASNNVAEKLPAIVTATLGEQPDSSVNLKVIHDGTSHDLWKTSVPRGDGEMSWNFPVQETPVQQ